MLSIWLAHKSPSWTLCRSVGIPLRTGFEFKLIILRSVPSAARIKVCTHAALDLCHLCTDLKHRNPLSAVLNSADLCVSNIKAVLAAMKKMGRNSDDDAQRQMVTDMRSEVSSLSRLLVRLFAL
jgi:hypothetical protein